MTCSAVSLLVPSSQEKKAQQAEIQISFNRPPSYLALLDCIEREPTALKLDQVNFHVKLGKQFVLQHNWADLVGNRAAIKLAVSFMVIASFFFFFFLLLYSFMYCNMCCWSLQAPCLAAICFARTGRVVICKPYALFMLQAHLCIPKHPMVTTRGG